LLQIAFARPATLEPGVHIGKDPLVGCNVLLRQRHQLHIADDIDVGLGGIQGDQFSSLSDAKRGGINPCGLAPDVMDRGKSIKQQLSNDHRLVAAKPPRPGPNNRCRQPGYRRTPAKVLIEFFGAIAGFDTNLGQQRTLHLSKF
jgi:hypothetical protein